MTLTCVTNLKHSNFLPTDYSGRIASLRLAGELSLNSTKIPMTIIILRETHNDRTIKEDLVFYGSLPRGIVGREFTLREVKRSELGSLIPEAQCLYIERPSHNEKERRVFSFSKRQKDYWEVLTEGNIQERSDTD